MVEDFRLLLCGTCSNLFNDGFLEITLRKLSLRWARLDLILTLLWDSCCRCLIGSLRESRIAGLIVTGEIMNTLFT
jgi:hypothetical protein